MALYYNKVIMAGNSVDNPELRHTPGGSPVCEIRMAVNRSYKQADGQNKDEVLFIDVTMFGKIAESCSRHIQKGSNILVEGWLKQDAWTDKQGNKREKKRLMAERIQFINTGNKTPAGTGNRDCNGETPNAEPRQNFRRPAPAERPQPQPPPEQHRYSQEDAMPPNDDYTPF